MVIDVNIECYQPATQARESLGFHNFHIDMDGVTDKNRLDEFPLAHLAESDHIGAQDAGLDSQAGGNRQPEQAMRDALSKGG